MSRKVTYTEQLDQLLEACFNELREMSDQDVLGGEPASSVKDRALKRIERAAAEAGRRRLVAARQEWKQRFAARQEKVPQLSPTEARVYVARATRDSRHTLAARNLEEMSDEDVLRLYEQIRELEAETSTGDP